MPVQPPEFEMKDAYVRAILQPPVIVRDEEPRQPQQEGGVRRRREG